MEKEDILNLEFFCDDLNKDISIRDYLKTLLSKLWECGEGFSGRRPFGNSGWEYDLYKPLIDQGIIYGVVDYGYIEEVDHIAGHRIIADLIQLL